MSNSELRKNKQSWIPFIILGIAYIIWHFCDGFVLWYDWFRQAGLLDTLIHSLLTIGAGPLSRNLIAPFWFTSTPNGVSSHAPFFYEAQAFPGVLVVLLMISAFLCVRANKKKSGIILSALSAVIPLLGVLNISIGFVLFGKGMNLIHSLLWLLYGVATVLLLMYSIKGKGANVFALICLIFGILSILGSIYLSMMSIPTYQGTSQFVGLNFWVNNVRGQNWSATKVLFGNGGEALISMVAPMSVYWPFSSAIYFFFCSAGFFSCTPVREPIHKRIRQKYSEATLNQSKQQHNETYSYLEQYKQQKKHGGK